ncbi:MAG: hypothetical protein U0892_10280 [Pirellulales bacterium]
MRRGDSDRCELFFHRPWNGRRYLVLGYVRSSQRTSLTSFYLATLVLDRIAEAAGSDFIVTELSNPRITDRLMSRWGWEQHCSGWSGRHFIKRFYGEYPAITPEWLERMNVPD